MREIRHTMLDPMGLHAKLASALAQVCKGYESDVVARHGGIVVPAQDIMGLMRLDVREGDTILVTVDGPDEEAAAEAIAALVKTF